MNRFRTRCCWLAARESFPRHANEAQRHPRLHCQYHYHQTEEHCGRRLDTCGYDCECPKHEHREHHNMHDDHDGDELPVPTTPAARVSIQKGQDEECSQKISRYRHIRPNVACAKAPNHERKYPQTYQHHMHSAVSIRTSQHVVKRPRFVD